MHSADGSRFDPVILVDNMQILHEKIHFLVQLGCNASSITLGRSGISHIAQVCHHHIPDWLPFDVECPTAPGPVTAE